MIGNAAIAAADNPPKPEIHIALVMKTLTNPFFIAMEKGARRAAQELGVDLVVKTAARETSATQQIAIIDKLVRDDEVKAIVIAPADSVGVIPALKRARDKGIIVINIDNQLDPAFAQKAGLVDIPFISVDNKKSAYLSAKVIADRVTTPSEAAILEGIPEAKNASERKDGAMQAFGENPKISLVATETAHWQVDEAHEVTKKIFTQHPHVALIFCANDMMALGVIQYLQEMNRPDVKVAGFDAIDEARAAIKAGLLAATIDQQPGEQGYLGIKYAYRAITGEHLPPVTVLDGLAVTQ
jgi:ribose transport system substrate-binding protein